MEAGKVNIGAIFNRARTMLIPFFQRAYVWEEANWQRFLDDMVEVGKNDKGYFLGSVIQKQQVTVTGTPIGDVRVVLDGQQRLTTLMLLFKVLCKVRDSEDHFQQTFYTYRNKLILQHNHNDVEVFEAIIRDELTESLRSKCSRNKVLGAYDFFWKHKDQIEAIDPLDLHNRVYFVGIDLHHEEDEQQIFDTINSLGVDLTTAELLKNELFSRNDIGLFERTWKQVFEGDEMDYWAEQVTAGRSRRENIDLFLQSFLLIQPNAPTDVRVDCLFAGYKDYLKDKVSDRAVFIKELTKCAKLYQEHINPYLLGREIDSNNAIERLNVVLLGLNTTTVVPYVLYILRHVDSSDERNRMFKLIESYLMRRLICQETPKNYNNLFVSFIRAGLNTHQSLSDRLAEAEDVTSRCPSAAMVASGFQQSNLTNQQAKVILYLLELSIRDDSRQSTSLNGMSHYSLEHLMPKKWRNNWGMLDSEAARERDHTLLKLGNLSLLSSSLNSSIRDGDWQTKKTGKGSRHGLLHYAQGLETLTDDLNSDVWNEDLIRSRGVRFSEQAIQVWSHPEVQEQDRSLEYH